MRPTAIRCLMCGASPGARCRTASGRYASQPHVARLLPRFQCPACGVITDDAINVTQGYCSSCHDWTGTSAQTGGYGQDGFDLKKEGPAL